MISPERAKDIRDGCSPSLKKIEYEPQSPARARYSRNVLRIEWIYC